MSTAGQLEELNEKMILGAYQRHFLSPFVLFLFPYPFCFIYLRNIY